MFQEGALVVAMCPEGIAISQRCPQRLPRYRRVVRVEHREHVHTGSFY
jgi:hypothetical protein